MPATHLFTGFPGFIGARLLPRLMELQPESRFTCLVQERFLAAAAEALAAMARDHPHTAGRVATAVGDITAPRLGLAWAPGRARGSVVTQRTARLTMEVQAPSRGRHLVYVGGRRVRSVRRGSVLVFRMLARAGRPADWAVVASGR